MTTPVQDAALTVGCALSGWVSRLDAAGIVDAERCAGWLMARALGCRRLELPLRRDELLMPAAAQRFDDWSRRLWDGEPLQYILGDADFMGHRIEVGPAVLIPRPETEGLVERVLGAEQIWGGAAPRVADVGTGSGCIAIALARARPAARFLAVDCSAAALAVARRNVKAHRLEEAIALVEGHLCEGIERGTLDAVVANPPYIASAACGSLPREVREHEPRTALDGGGDGLAVIRPLVDSAARALRKGGFLFLEMGETQRAAVRALMAEAGYGMLKVSPDAAGRDRYIEGILL